MTEAEVNGAYAWYYRIPNEDTYYWAYSWEIRTTDFAEKVSEELGYEIGPGEVVAASKSLFDRINRPGNHLIHIV